MGSQIGRMISRGILGLIFDRAKPLANNMLLGMATAIKLRGLNRFFILLTVSTLLSVPGLGAVKKYVPPTPEQIETELLELINRDREQLGGKPLQHHPLLQEIARSHSAKMAVEKELSHYFPGWPTPDQKMQQHNLCFLVSAENIAHSQTPVAKFIHEALMASLCHRVSILDRRMLQAGIGVCKMGDDFYVTEEFAAIIDCPAPETAMAFIENELCRWQKEKFTVAPVIESGARLLAKVSAQQYLFGNPIDLQGLSDKEMKGVNIRCNDMATVLVKLKEVINGKRITSLVVGVVWGRNMSFPGGTYSVCLLLFE